jgi:hypothetical protein
LPVAISGLTLTNGSAVTGGAIDDLQPFGTLNVSNCIIGANVATSEGGGIAFTAATAVSAVGDMAAA